MSASGRIRIRARRPAVVELPLPAADRFAAIVGSLTHRVVAELAALRDHAPEELVDLAWTSAGVAVEGAALAHRARQARLAISGAAAVYVRRFLPPPEWRLVAAEHPLGGGHRADLVWASGSGLLLDELKTGDHRGGDPATDSIARQVDGYVERAAAQTHAAFLGLRLLFLHSANDSLLVRPDGRRIPLDDTPYRFGPPAGADVWAR